MRLRRRRPEPPTVKQMEAQAEDALYGDYVREPHRQAIVEPATVRSAPLEALREHNDEALAWELEALDPESRRLVLLR